MPDQMQDQMQEVATDELRDGPYPPLVASRRCEGSFLARDAVHG
jgi:hypothetical protein